MFTGNYCLNGRVSKENQKYNYNNQHSSYRKCNDGIRYGCLGYFSCSSFIYNSSIHNNSQAETDTPQILLIPWYNTILGHETKDGIQRVLYEWCASKFRILTCLLFDGNLMELWSLTKYWISDDLAKCSFVLRTFRITTSSSSQFERHEWTIWSFGGTK